MAATRFDLRALFRSIAEKREHRGLSWAALAREVGVASSTMRRFADADDAEADGVLALVRWLGRTPENFVTSTTVTGLKLHPHGDGYVRVDMELIAEANGDPRGADGRTRTTIQHLVETAERSAQAVASFTRLSDG